MMKSLPQLSARNRRRGGFTLPEILIATAASMVLLFGALYSTSETYAVVRQGDAKVYTQVHARRTMDRFIKDCRYATSLTVTGDETSGWTIDMITGLESDSWTWQWDPNSQQLTLSDGDSTETVIQQLQQFGLETELGDSGGIARITATWQMIEQFGNEAGAGTGQQSFTLASGTWVRQEAL
jgi:type II secretory pathway component PulJ